MNVRGKAPSAERRTLALLGNEAVGRGIVEAGCHMAMAYPGTPSSEVLPAVVRFAKEEGVHVYTEWSANEKVALEQVLAASYVGKRGAVVMKQVGLNVAADPLMSAAYIGVVGGVVIVVADDPGPTSSQTEQDTRQFAHFAKVPVLDPSSPDEARRMVAYALDLSERHGTPVILRTALRVCHGRQDIVLDEVRVVERRSHFERDPARWAATPRHRYTQHVALDARLRAVAAEFEEERRYNRILNEEASSPFAIVTGGNPFAVLMDLLEAHGLERSVPILKVGTPHPLPRKLVEGFVSRYQHVLVLEETDQVIELLLHDRNRVMGRHDGTVPDEGELDGGVIGRLVSGLLVRFGLIEERWDMADEATELASSLSLPVRPPTLCVACPHRGSFFAIRRVGGKAGIYPSDIGCYTLGLNMEAVDTCHDMGAAISMAAGFYHAYAHDRRVAATSAAEAKDGRGKGAEPKIPKIIATIGDSTFYHAGLSPLACAVSTNARFTLVILDNMVTAMTGMQPTLLSGIQADGSMGRPLGLEDTCKGLGVRHVEVVDPYDVPATIATLKSAIRFNRAPDGGPAVVIARRPCVIHQRDSFEPVRVEITDRCNRCDICLDYFGCPALVPDGERVEIDRALCVDCGVCLHSCSRGGIVTVGSPEGGGGETEFSP